MRFNNVCIECFGYQLPENVVTSIELEGRLKPLYDRIGLIEGRLELMSGIRERRFWNPGTLPSQVAAAAGLNAIEKSGISSADIKCLINCSVSRDFVEPATSTAVHRLLNLSKDCMNFDISNACLGMASGLLVIANMIELGQIDCGMAVCGENAGPLVNNTIEKLNADLSMTRNGMKSQFASLTIGSCAAAVILTSSKKSHTKHKLLAAANVCNTSAGKLCQGDANGGMTDDSAPLMATDSQALLKAGVDVAANMWKELKTASGWDETTPDVICTHQVGKAHTALLYQSLGINKEKDFNTYPFLGNCGSASWPVTCAMAVEQERVIPDTKLAVLGIGSGINCTGMAIQW